MAQLENVTNALDALDLLLEVGNSYFARALVLFAPLKRHPSENEDQSPGERASKQEPEDLAQSKATFECERAQENKQTKVVRQKLLDKSLPARLRFVLTAKLEFLEVANEKVAPSKESQRTRSIGSRS